MAGGAGPGGLRAVSAATAKRLHSLGGPIKRSAQATPRGSRGSSLRTCRCPVPSPEDAIHVFRRSVHALGRGRSATQNRRVPGPGCPRAGPRGARTHAHHPLDRCLCRRRAAGQGDLLFQPHGQRAPLRPGQGAFPGGGGGPWFLLRGQCGRRVVPRGRGAAPGAGTARAGFLRGGGAMEGDLPGVPAPATSSSSGTTRCSTSDA